MSAKPINPLNHIHGPQFKKSGCGAIKVCGRL